ncbi:hypothetical protein EVAR_40865_1 [Eumeta japonica]|uniref:Uncharacterized protein n=1 Tax=Eumeta variegata TaxID=151549 RepID=A0A4C1X6R4_EUMVA|nr:hypothetical protein EVAR_40865_1 [Eumeta japonica]
MKMSESDEVSKEVWKRWILEAIHKIRSQKQRPSVERICHAIRQHHNYHEDVVSERLEYAVREGAVLKVYNKGQSSYKDPGGLQSKALRFSPDADVSRAVAKAVRELGERDGSSLRSIERYIRQAYVVKVEGGADVRTVLRAGARRAVARGLLVQHANGYKPTERPPGHAAADRAHKRLKHLQLAEDQNQCQATGVTVCSECLGTEARNSSGAAESLICCYQCKSYVHPSCLNILDHVSPTALKVLRWSCGECTWCMWCTARGGWVARCAGGCPRAAHVACAHPPWRCDDCRDNVTPKRTATGVVVKGRKSKTPIKFAVDSDDERSDGNDHPSFARIESEQRMSKEKQKFFRFSAFNLIKKRRCRESSSSWDGWDEEGGGEDAGGARWGGVRVTRYSQLELRLRDACVTRPRPRTHCRPRDLSSPSLSSDASDDSGPSASPSPSPATPPPSHPPPLLLPPAPTQISSVFERLGSKSDPCESWGFAAEAQKQSNTEGAAEIRTKTDHKPKHTEHRRQERARTTARRSRCGERLLTTLFDGLSEFYAVRNASRSQSRHRVAYEDRRPDNREVLKETRSTFKQYQASLADKDKERPASRPAARNPTYFSTERKMVPSKDKHKPPYQHQHAFGKNEIRSTYSYNNYDHYRSESPMRSGVDEAPVTPSALVKTAAFAKHHQAKEDLTKLYKSIEHMSREPDLEFLRESLSFDFHDRRRNYVDPSSNKYKSHEMRSTTNQTGKIGLSATRTFEFI